MCERKIEREVQKHILGFLDSGLSLSPGVRAKYSAEDHLNVLLKTAFEQKYIQGTARRLRSNWELHLLSGWTARRLLGSNESRPIISLHLRCGDSGKGSKGKVRASERSERAFEPGGMQRIKLQECNDRTVAA